MKSRAFGSLIRVKLPADPYLQIVPLQTMSQRTVHRIIAVS